MLECLHLAAKTSCQKYANTLKVVIHWVSTPSYPLYGPHLRLTVYYLTMITLQRDTCYSQPLKPLKKNIQTGFEPMQILTLTLTV
jgi:hypothetical protein